ncbi:MAG TPA: FAD-binding and (Fe-S)-binding domain-containing protein [Sporichthyaceae bacterium]|jgi:FAD/FMN-containing dehydrogenase/Fe-S oxidoreductase|nr:FAD-binding and (Fe-S)-binding domain-containing protein [Sporichthyaceae bacterium]
MDFIGELRAALPPAAVDDAVRRRAEYSADASVYRHVPRAVVFPGSADEVAVAVAVAAAHRVPVTMRGGGTSVAGNAIGPGIVLDCSRRFNRILDLDPASATAVVEPGVVLDRLRAAGTRHGLTFGPDPSTHSRATLGGMVGNNACGSHSPVWGRTVDHVQSLDVLLADGTRTRVGELDPSAAGRVGALHRALQDLTDRHGEAIRAGLGQFPRQASGYGLHHLLSENGRHVAKALVGSEGTCAVLLGATVSLVPVPRARVLLVLAFDDLVDAADAIGRIVPWHPATCEGLDRTLLPTGADPAAAGLPPGDGWLLLEFTGADRDAAQAAACAARDGIAAEVTVRGAAVVVDAAAQAVIWRIREEGAGTATRAMDSTGRRVAAWPGWEDAAVPVDRLGDYLRGFRALMREHGRRGVLYGHFADGCMHVRIDFDLRSAAGVAGYRKFLEQAADLVAAHGGSCSGEHGDGQARSALLRRTFAPAVLTAFAEFKAAWDPGNLLNPGILVDPRPVDHDLRPGPRTSLPLVFAYPEDGGSLADALDRCVGVAKCRQQTGGVMCPSFRATGDEKDSTRGRARVLAEMLRGELIADGWRSTEVRDALDLCLACKGCRSDCPVAVDMATYKAEFLHHHYRRRLRPAAHWSMGFLPVWARLARRAPGAANLFSRGPTGRLLRRVGGLTEHRPLPRFAPRSTPLPAAAGPEAGPRVALWVDTFTAAYAPHVAAAAVDVLAAAGLRVLVVPGTQCCGLTWIHTGQLTVARRVLARTLDVLGPAAVSGTPIVGLEPSCLAALRTDLPGLFADDPRAAAVAEVAVSLSQALERLAPDWRPPGRLSGPVAVLVHCHQHATAGAAADLGLLERCGATTRLLDSGCCGGAGAFGYEREHYETSVAVARAGLLPALQALEAAVPVVADGFSCRGQTAHLTQRRVVHVVELLHPLLASDTNRWETGTVSEGKV